MKAHALRDGVVDPMRSFALRARVVAPIGNGQYDALRASLDALVDARDLVLDGTWSPEPSFVMHRGGRVVDDADRRAVAVWAAARREFVDYTVGPLVCGVAPSTAPIQRPPAVSPLDLSVQSDHPSC